MLRLLFLNILFLFIVLLKSVPVYSSDEKTNLVEFIPKIANDPPKVITSIKPLQLIVIAITGTTKNTEVLLSAKDSPHSYQLKFSDTRKLQSADIFIWLGEAMEGFLPKIISKLDKKTTKIKILDLPDLKKLPYKTKDHMLSHPISHSHDHSCNHVSFDPHVWMDFDNIKLIARVITTTLADMDKKNSLIYNNNLQYFLSQLDSFKHKSAKSLNKICDAEIFAFHDAYSYLENQYDFTILDYFSLDSTKEPGAKHLYNIKNKLQKAKKPCLLIEPQFDASFFHRLVADTKVNISYIDPLAGDIIPDANGYILFLDSLVQSLANCIIKK